MGPEEVLGALTVIDWLVKHVGQAIETAKKDHAWTDEQFAAVGAKHNEVMATGPHWQNPPEVTP